MSISQRGSIANFSSAQSTTGARYYSQVGGAIPGVANTLVFTSGTSATQNFTISIDNERCSEEVTFILSNQNDLPTNITTNLTGATISAGDLQSTGGTVTYDGGVIGLGTYYATLDAEACNAVSEVPLMIIVE